MSKNIQEIVQLIETCPVWNLNKGESKDEIVKNQLIVNRFRAISKYSINDIENAVIQYVKKVGPSKDSFMVKTKKIYILNRYLFNVPKYVDRKKWKGFFGLSGMPFDDQVVGLMWPLDFDKSGKIILLDTHSMHMGPRYMAVEEFRYFKSLYGLRKHPN